MLTLRAGSLADTRAIAAGLAAVARRDDIIVLAGEMGAGKTAFAQGFGAALGVSEPITSPTFTLVHTYDTGRLTVHHADLYRLDRMAEVADLALAELVEGDGVLLIEWGDAIASTLGEHLMVHLRLPGPDDTPVDVRADLPAASLDAGADRADDAAPDSGVASRGPVERIVTLSAHGRSWAQRWERIVSAMAPFEWTPSC